VLYSHYGWFDDVGWLKSPSKTTQKITISARLPPLWALDTLTAALHDRSCAPCCCAAAPERGEGAPGVARTRESGPKWWHWPWNVAKSPANTIYMVV